MQCSSLLIRLPRLLLTVEHWTLVSRLKVKVHSFAVFRGIQIDCKRFCCQDACFPARVSTYSLSVAMASSFDSSSYNLHHILLVSRRSKAAVDWQGRSFSTIHSPKLPDGERTLLANNMVFWSSSSNCFTSSDPIAAICSL